ncbi:MAG: hypothetical protein RL648_437, partial [Verrucomicrobiota bacterium]
FIGSPPMNFIYGLVEVSDAGTFFVSTEGASRLRLELGPKLRTIGRAHAGRPLVLGIRPENIPVAASVAKPHPPQCVEATIDVAEPMGSETYLYLLFGHASSIAKVPSGVTYRPGESLKVWFDLEQAHLFDAESEAVLG